MKIKEIFNKQADLWTQQNIEFFGITPKEWLTMSSDETKQHLDQDVKDYWDPNKPESLCEIAGMIYEGKICRDNDHILKDTVSLRNNIISGCVDIFADFQTPSRHFENVLIASIPSPAPDLTWIINKIKYTPRISAYKDYGMVRNSGKKIVQNGEWNLDLDTGEIEIKSKNNPNAHPIELITGRSKALMEAAIGEPLTEDNFVDACRLIPVLENTSLYNYGFSHLDMFFDVIRTGSRFANPLKNIQLGINTIFMRQNHSFDVSDKLVSSKSPIFSLENYRTAVYKTSSQYGGANSQNKSKIKNGFVPSFAFTDSQGLFDAFKTTTNSAAGRHRLLLDNVFCHDQMLWVRGSDGKDYNMFDIMFGRYKNTQNISSISSSMFCNNNDPKRIMMTSKLSAQAIPVEGQADIFTNRVPARVVFGDFKGWSYADSILISESFARKLQCKEVLTAEVGPKSRVHDIKMYKNVGDDISVEEMSALFPTLSVSIIKGYEYIKIKSIEDLSESRYRLVLEVMIPFRPGDKLTNLHGSKGVSGLIIPDEDMPRLKNDIGDFKAGPFEVIISGFSVLRRGSLGQLFEAWATAAGIDFEFGEDFAINAIKKYGKEMKEFSEQSVIEFEGVETLKPCGVIDMIRLYHHATTKVSLSYIRNDSRKMLNLGNMEKMNLAATSKYEILRELSVRSTKKYENSYFHIHNLIKNGTVPNNLITSSSFARILKSTGLSLEAEGVALVESDESVHDELQNREYEAIITEISSNDVIDLDEIYGPTMS